jgi:anti-sigma B factor antagonist
VARPQGQRCKAGACHLELQDAVAGEAHVLRLSGELDLGSAAELEAAIVSICGSGPRAVSLDLRGLIFIDSSGLHAIISARERCAQLGCDFRLIPGPPAVQRLFELTGMLDELPFARTADAANANS